MRRLLLILCAIFMVCGVAQARDSILVAKKKAGGFAWASYLQAHYNFETADVANDETANANDLTVSGATASNTHYVEGSYSIIRDATDDSIQRPDTNLSSGFPGKASSGYQNFLISGWFWQNTAPAANTTRDLVSKYCSTASERSWKATIWYTSGQAPHFKIQMSAAGTSGDVSKEFTSADGTGWPDTIETGRWYFFAFWHDQALDKWGAYIYDASTETGSTYYSTTYTSGVNIGSGSTSAFAIGQYTCSNTYTEQRTDGWVDHVIVYGWPNTVNPTESEIQTRIAALQALTAP